MAEQTSRALVAGVRRRLTESGRPATGAALVDAVRAERRMTGGQTLLRLAEDVRSEIDGAGPLQPLLADGSVTDVLVNGGRGVWVDRGNGLERVDVRLDADAVQRLAQRLASACGRRLDDASPFVDARLPDGTRLHAALATVAPGGPFLSLRTFRPRGFTLDELVSLGTMPVTVAGLLADVVAARIAYLVTGGTGSGKTSLLGTLLGRVAATERILIVEDAAELRPRHPHAVTLEARRPNAEGAGEVALRELVRQALRMRPDRIVIGECRGGEVVELLAALNTGQEGGAGTLHANSPIDVPPRLEALALAGGLGRDALHAQVAAALKLIVHLRRSRTGRIVEEICLLSRDPSTGRLAVGSVWHHLRGHGPAAPALADMLHVRGGRS